MTYHPDQHTEEARAKRAQRAAWRKAPGDPLGERARKAQFWTECNKTNKHYGLVHSRAFYRHPSIIRHLMPRTRAHIKARTEARRSAYAAELAKLKGQRAVLCSLLRECLPVIDALMQMPGDDDSDARLNGLAGRITGALNALAEDQVKGGES